MEENFATWLDEYLVEEVELDFDVVMSMTPREKLANWLIYNGIIGYTEDIIGVISAAYNINLKDE